MAVVTWTDSALNQLNDIAEYIAFDNTLAARRLVQKVMSATDRLADFPLLGKCPVELNESIYRELTVSPCRVFYRVEDTQVVVVHVMRQEQMLRRYLLTEAPAPAYG
ncbi:type II toxin-antitoxin system RelE/ParE family toxin [Saccharospirillum salsuginis]|uniref:Plasmid stabilization protein n=1 Tax=Saccharospirillum salsuginis TaxID=418750 RepID=A0A918K379_9GAMM|nr:type II toxin-antitoxin system RelE/ParE family toxin [Saccharospirillum salsuginis]GGX46299.1 plasmid stabilization protein [Saccharospirillum salsuginis]